MKIVDLHCDTLYKYYENNDYSISDNDGHITDTALIKGDYMAQCFAIYIPAHILGEESYAFFENQYSIFNKVVNDSKILKKAKTEKEITNNKLGGNVSAVLTVENAELLNGRLERIFKLEECGVKVLGLIHNGENCLGFPHTDYEKPLKSFGREVVEALNYSDITIDVAHLNYKGFFDVASLSKKTFISSHSGCDAICHHTRNLTDEQILKIAQSGGVIGIPFYSTFLNGGAKTEIDDIVRHIEHLINIGGEEAAALGTDFDGMNCELFLKDCSQIPLLSNELIKKFGFNTAEKICYKNALRIL